MQCKQSGGTSPERSGELMRDGQPRAAGTIDVLVFWLPRSVLGAFGPQAMKATARWGCLSNPDLPRISAVQHVRGSRQITYTPLGCGNTPRSNCQSAQGSSAEGLGPSARRACSAVQDSPQAPPAPAEHTGLAKPFFFSSFISPQQRWSTGETRRF